MNAHSLSTSSRNAASRVARFLAAVCILGASLVPLAAHADVPGRVGRIAFIEGDVQAYSESEPEWKVAYLNQPITSRNSVFVGDAGRAEISVGSTTLAMDAGSQVDIQQLDDNTFDANVVRGRISVRIRRLDPSDLYTVAVPGADFALLKPGRYRIDALQSSGGITVFAGQASVDGDRGTTLVEEGNGLRVVVGNDSNAPPQLLSSAPVPVPLDDWVVARENRFRNSQAERYVSPNMTGYEDLDANGRWATEEDIGPVWYPTTYVQQDWAPYRYGRWSYVAPWGYTWIDDAPWGFAPFHYGRWVQVGSRWGWSPGAYVARPVYAPALVGFYGGSGLSASFSIGVGPAVGWYPLAPWQRYSPHYTQNARYINQVNNITVINPPRRFGDGNGSRDWNRDHGGTLAPQDAFASQRSISRVAIAAPRNFGDRGGPVNVGDLPRPAQVPGAVRRGPENGNGRPDFRSPREFASRPGEGGQRPFEQGGRPAAPVINNVPATGVNGLPPNYRRMPDDRRQPGGVDGARPNPVPQGEGQGQQPRSPANFNRGEGRPQPQFPQGSAQGEGQGYAVPAPARIEQRPQQAPQQQPQQPAGIERPFERPNREMRNMQQPQPIQQAPAAVEQRQPRFERPQAPPVVEQRQPPQGVEQRQQRFERPAQPQPQPQQPMIERPQRIERPSPPPAVVAPAAPPPAAPVVQQRTPQPQGNPRGDGDRAGPQQQRMNREP